MIVYVEVMDEYPTFVVRSDEFHYTTRVDVPEGSPCSVCQEWEEARSYPKTSESTDPLSAAS
jgi:hypothetical protein